MPTALIGRLSELRTDELVSFGIRYQEYMDAAFDMRLWAAGFVICGGCSNDGFTDFRAWLIARGMAVYHNALIDPDSLVSVYDPATDDTGAQLELLNYAVSRAYRKKTCSGDLEAMLELEALLPRWHPPAVKNGDKWDGNTSRGALARVVPKLVNRFMKPDQS